MDQLLHGPQPLCQSAMAEQVGAIFQEHSCLPFLQGSRPYLRSVQLPRLVLDFVLSLIRVYVSSLWGLLFFRPVC